MFRITNARPKSLETRFQILQIALGLFRQRGLNDTTMRDIAAAADMSLGAAYYYFPSKEAIIPVCRSARAPTLRLGRRHASEPPAKHGHLFPYRRRGAPPR